MWHSVSGLVVSPFNRTLPSAVVSNPKSTRPDDLTNPRLLQDDNIYLAFYPRRAIHRGTLFSVLSIRSDLLSNSIMPVTESSGTESSRYALDPSIQSRWKTLETPLLQVAQTLYAAHPDKANFPPLLYPRWPHQYGYEDSHRTKELAYDCAKKSLAAFSMLVAFTTFVLSLWLTEYEDDCFAAAFAVLAQRHRDGLPRVWLEYLKDSIVGDLSPGLRPGGFLNPYSTRWGAYLLRFTRASVPFWLLWGTDDIKHAHLADRKIDYFFPPREYIELAKQRCLTLSIRFISLNLSPFTIFFKIFLYTYIDIIVKTTHAKNLRIWWSRCQDTRSSSTRTFDGGTTKSGTRYKHLPQVPMTDGRLMNSMYSFPL